MNADHVLLTFGLAAYALAAILYLLAFPKVKEQRARLANAAFVLFWGATGAMTVVLASAYFCLFDLPCTSRPFSGILLVATISWLTILAYYVFKMRLLGTFVAPIATLILLIEFFTLPTGGHSAASAPSVFLMFHIATAVIGEAFAICACAVAILYLMQQRVIKTKQISLLTALAPSLDKLDTALFICLWTGFLFITIGLVTGAVSVILYSTGNRPGIEWKILWAMVVWGWYLAILLAKNTFNFSGRRIAGMCLAGFLLLAICFFGLYPWGGLA